MTDLCHGCNAPVARAVVTTCSYCDAWGYFCSQCLLPGATKCRNHAAALAPAIASNKGYFSASQIDSYQDCPRKWAWQYIDGLPKPTNIYAEFGLALHKSIERYLLEGIPFDLTTDVGEAALAGIHLLPSPGTAGMEIEKEFRLDGWGHLFLGYKDIQINRVIDGQLIPLVIDHKSTGNFKWAKTPADLIKNIQAVLYATDAMIKTGSNACDLRWIYYKRTKPFQAKPVDIRVNRETLEPTLGKIKGLADEMALIKSSGVRAIHLPPNVHACMAYGGCPYVRNCNLSPREKMLAIMNQAELEARKNQFLAGIRPGGAGPAINPPGQSAPPPQFQPPPQAAPPPVAAAPTIDAAVLAQARASHPNWDPGTPWYNGQAYVNPDQAGYPPVFIPPPQSAPMPPPAESTPPSEGEKKAGRPKKKAEAIALAVEGMRRMADGWTMIIQAVEKGLWD